jgi:hypothetical protein
MFNDRLWMYMGFRIRAGIAQTPSGEYRVLRLVVQRSATSVPMDVRLPDRDHLVHTRIEDAFNTAYRHARKMIDEATGDGD